MGCVVGALVCWLVFCLGKREGGKVMAFGGWLGGLGGG